MRIVVPAYPAFNIYSRIAKTTTALGPVCIATAVHEMPGWDVEVIDENNFSRYGHRSDVEGADHEFLQLKRPADIVGFYGGLTSTIPRLYRIARFYKEKGIVTVAGGQHFVPETLGEALSSGIDYVVIGEGEETIKELLEALEGKREISGVKGLAFLDQGNVVFTEKREPIIDFDRLPLPDFSLVRNADISLYPVERIRACGMDCEFCTVKGKPRPASPERLLERISLLVETKNARHFFIVDDLFGQQRDETIRFCKMLKSYQEDIGRKLDITAQIRLDKAKDTELLMVMREAHINNVAIGFESPIEEELRAMNKKIKPAEMIALARIYHKFGFLVHGMFIFGYPLKEGVDFKMSVDERIKRFRRFIRDAKIDTVQVLLAGPLPGTALRQRLLDQHRVYSSSDIGWEYYDGNFPLFEPDAAIDPEEMQAATRKIMGRFYRFRNMFAIGLHMLYLPAFMLYLPDLKASWRKWYRSWGRFWLRFGGWVILRGWTQQFKKGRFINQLRDAKQHLKKSKNRDSV